MQWKVSAAPHVHAKDSTATLMLDVIAALMPCVVAGIWLFGYRAAIVVAVSVAACVLTELVCQKIAKKPIRINDLSAVVTGIILALNLPSTAPWWMILIGAIIAIGLVKQLFGGIGDNFLNPALTARAVLLASWPARMTATNTASAYPLPFDTVTSATVLTPETTLNTTMVDMLVGRIPGTIGEVCKVAILLGLVYLLIRRTITWHIPVVMVGTFMLSAWAFGLDPIHAVLSGGILFGAVFMATDYVTSPMTKWGQVIYAAGAGLIVALIRTFGSYPEGVTYAILFMNVVTPLIDRAVKPRIYGEVKSHA